MFGRKPRLPIDLILDDEQSKKLMYTQHISGMKNRLKQAYEIATKLANKGRIKQKNYYDQKARAAVVEPGDRVLVKILAFQTRHKISDK